MTLVSSIGSAQKKRKVEAYCSVDPASASTSFRPSAWLLVLDRQGYAVRSAPYYGSKLIAVDIWGSDERP